MKTHQTTDGTDAQDAGYLDTTNDLIPVRPAAAAIRRKRLRCLASSGRPGAFGSLAVGFVLAWAATAFLAVGLQAQGPDNWIAIGDGIKGANGAVIHMVTDGTGNVYVAGNFTVIADVAANYVAKWDGQTWSALGSGVDDQVVALAVSGTDLYAAGIFTTAGGVVVNKVAKWDGTVWSALGSGIVGTEVSELAVLGGDLYAGGSFGEAGGVAVQNIARWDGTSWSVLGSGLDGWVSTMAVDGTNLYVGGKFDQAGGVAAHRVARWDGTLWSGLGFNGSIGLSGAEIVRSLVMFQGDLYAGGYFFNAGVDGNGRCVARWDGAQWTSLGGTGVRSGGRIRRMAASDDALYVGGDFTGIGHVSGVPNSQYIAKWDGTAWSALGAGIDVGPSWWIAVRAVAVVGDSVFAGGDFDRVDGQWANHIASWDGTNWSSFGSETLGDISDLREAVVVAASGADVVVGGASRLVHWNGTSWSTLATGLNLQVQNYPMGTVAIAGSDVYLSGDFEAIEGVAANRIARWDGTSWSALGSGLDGVAVVLTASGNGLYAGGTFTSAGSAEADNIARWDGTQWASLGGGVNGSVRAILVSGSDVYAAGDFTTAGGLPASRVAKWDGSQWAALGTGLSDRVASLAMWKSDLYAASRGTQSAVYRWDGTQWTTIASTPDGTIGTFPTLASAGEHLYALSQQQQFALSVSQWDGTDWTHNVNDLPFRSRWPAISVSNDSFYYAGDAGANDALGGKASPVVGRYYLGNVPPMEIGDGIARLYFRTNTDQAKGVTPGRVHRIERSTDLTGAWEHLGYIYAGETGGIDFTDASAPAERAFYRAMPVEP